MRRSVTRGSLWGLALIPSVWLAVQFHDLPHLGDFHDDALYLVSAKAIAQGEGHRMSSLPPIRTDSPPAAVASDAAPYQTKYPPLYPAWLSNAWRANPNFPANLGWFLPLAWIWLPALAIVSRLVFLDLGFSPGWSLGLSAMVLVNPMAAYFATSLMAELMMATLLMLSLALAERKQGAASGLAAALALLAKSAAMPALITIPVLFGLRRQFRQGSYFLAIAWPAFLGWTLWAANHRDVAHVSDYYVDYLGFYLANHNLADLPGMAITNLPILIMGAGRLLAFTSGYTGWSNYLATLLGLVGMFSFLRLRFSHYQAFLLAFLPMLIFWNFTPHERFLIPVLPFLIAGLGAEVRQMPKMMPWARPVAAAFVLSVLYLNLEGVFRELPKVARGQRERRHQLEPVYQWIAHNTPANARFAAAQDPVLWLYTGRTARGMHFPTKYFYGDRREAILHYFADLPEFMRQHQLDYALVVDDDFALDLSPEEVKARSVKVLSNPALRCVHREGKASVMVLASPPASEQRGPARLESEKYVSPPVPPSPPAATAVHADPSR